MRDDDDLDDDDRCEWCGRRREPHELSIEPITGEVVCDDCLDDDDWDDD